MEEIRKMQDGRVDGFSYLRVLATVAVLVLHTLYVAFTLHQEELPLTASIVTMSAVNICMAAAPCFIMISGALLLEPGHVMTAGKLKGYIRRVVLALLFCSVLFWLFDSLMDGSGLNLSGFLTSAKALVTGGGWSHLWYLYMLLALYLLLPFYRLIVWEASDDMLRYLLLLCFVFLSMLPLLRIAGMNAGFYINISTVYPFYFYLGYVIHSGRLGRIGRAAAVLLLTGGAALMVLVTALRFCLGLEALDYLRGYSSPLVVSMTVGSFVLVSEMNRLPEKMHRLLLAVDRQSFGIYLLHLLWVRLVLRYWNFNPYEYGGMAAVIFLLLIFGNLLLSYVLTWLLKRLKMCKNFYKNKRGRIKK